MTSPSPSKCSSIDCESVVDFTSAEDLEESDRSTELPVIRTSPFKVSVGTTLVSSPTSPSFNGKFSICPLEKATGEAYQEVTRTTTSTSTSPRTTTTRSRSTTTSSWSSDSTEFSSIAPLSETNFPSSMPRIAFADWQKFGIELFTPKPQKINSSNMYYEYHSIRSNSDRPRSGRSNSHPASSTSRTNLSKSQSYSIFGSKEEDESNLKPKLLLRRATLEGYYCPEL